MVIKMVESIKDSEYWEFKVGDRGTCEAIKGCGSGVSLEVLALLPAGVLMPQEYYDRARNKPQRSAGIDRYIVQIHPISVDGKSKAKAKAKAKKDDKIAIICPIRPMFDKTFELERNAYILKPSKPKLWCKNFDKLESLGRSGLVAQCQR